MGKINQILLDIYDWIRRLLWFRKKKVSKRPYELIGAPIYGKYGIIRRVKRDTVREVLTYIYTPIANVQHKDFVLTKVQRPKHIYQICIDHLWAVEGQPAKRHTVGQPSHEINVVKSSTTIDEDGSFECTSVFQGKYDFVGKRNSYRDKLVLSIIMPIIEDLKEQRIETYDWHTNIQINRRIYMGNHYFETLADAEERRMRESSEPKII